MTQLFGYSPLPPDAVLEQVLAGRHPPGDWIVATDDLVASSIVGAVPYFVTYLDGRLLHGPDLFALAATRRTPWRWNPKAFRDLVWQGHASGSTTIHADIHRMPSDSIARARDGRLRFEDRGTWTKPVADGSVDAAIDAMRATLAEWAGSPLVSLSGGYDSRVLLAAVLAGDRRPRVAVMGPPGSGDRSVAEILAQRFQLDLEVVEIPADRYLAAGPAVARLTGGAKLASNWHTYLYAQAIRHHEGPHFVGANGEFARTFYAKGRDAMRLVDAVPPRAAVGLYFAARAAIRQRRAPSLVPAGPRRVAGYAREQSRHVHPRGRALDALDRYYATQRVRQLIGDGMALYRSSGLPVSPFLEEKWITAIRGLGREWKVAERFHLAALERLAPELRAVPFDSGGLPYTPWVSAVTSTEAVEEIVDCSELDELWPRAARAKASGSPAALDLLQTMRAAIAARDGA